MVTELTKPGDKLIGKRIHAQFRAWDPLNGPAIDGNKYKYVLTGRVSCRIERPLSKTE